MSLYTLVLFIHILGVIGLFVGLSFLWAGVLRLRRARTVAEVRAGTRLAGSQRILLLVSSLLVLAAGVYLVEAAWQWETPWILLSLATLVVIGVLNSAISARRLATIEKAVADDAGGLLPPTVQRQLADPVLLTSVQTAGMLGLGVVFLMTVKPDLVGSLITLVVALVLGVVSALFWRPAAANALAQETAARL
jgi:hypothetical protein